jgi:OOP family OmpA-OmpF porin
MRGALIGIGWPVISVLCIAFLPFSLNAQQFKDCRVSGGCTEEDYARTLFPAEQPEQPRIRGVPTPGAPSPSVPSGTPPAMALNVLFDFNSDKISPKYHPELDNLGKVLARYSDYRIGIEGHTDNVGSDRYNRVLSERRAESVKRYLVQSHSVEPRRLDVKGYGKSKPRTTNDTPQGRDENRRVEVVNLGKR